MSNGLGIAALILAIVAIFIPFYGLFISGVAIICAVGAALAGDRAFATATPIIAGVNTFFLSPLTLAALGISTNGEYSALWWVILLFIVAPFFAIALNAKGKFVIGV